MRVQSFLLFGATALTVNAADLAATDGANPGIEGRIIDVTGTGEKNQDGAFVAQGGVGERHAFENKLPVVPEPAAVFLGVLGVLLLLLRRK